MTKIVAMPVCARTTKYISGTGEPDHRNLVCRIGVSDPIIYKPWALFDLNLYYSKVKFNNKAFSIEKNVNNHFFFSENVVTFVENLVDTFSLILS